MIVLDSSAVIAVALGEADAGKFSDVLGTAEEVVISTGTVVEIGVVLASKNREGASIDAMHLLAAASVRQIPVSERHALLAIEAYERYGKGRGHPAQLNYGDCFSYALAKSLNAPLLFKGDDFAQTDVVSAL